MARKGGKRFLFRAIKKDSVAKRGLGFPKTLLGAKNVARTTKKRKSKRRTGSLSNYNVEFY